MSTLTQTPVSDAQKNKWAQTIRGNLAVVRVSDPVALDFITRQVVNMCVLAFFDGLIYQVERDAQAFEKTMEGTK